jgi:hypothetical protein
MLPEFIGNFPRLSFGHADSINTISNHTTLFTDKLLGIIDDMGLKALPKHSGEYLLEVIMRRYENRSTIMTSNRPLEEWGKLLCDVPTAGAIIDRFLHHAHVVVITGKSYRVKEAPVVIQETKKSKKSLYEGS